MENEEIFEAKQHLIKRIRKLNIDSKLTDKELDVLGLIAFLQPVSSNRINKILGFNVTSCVSHLIHENLIMTVCHNWKDHSELYGTTKEFLNLTHLKSISCLPKTNGKIPKYHEQKRKFPDRAFLKSIDIQGFKYFKNKTHIEFSPELNGIYGPGRVGKTTILNAIKWCLSKNKPNVNDFFSGNEDNPAMDFAEVELTFSKVAKQNSDITIKRRIEKSGECKIMDDRFYNGKRINYKELNKALDLEKLSKSFFLFDEIDLSLDDVNYPVFIEMLNQVKKNTQCFLVTKKKETCNECNTMIGVTAEDDGLPQIIELHMN